MNMEETLIRATKITFLLGFSIGCILTGLTLYVQYKPENNNVEYVNLTKLKQRVDDVNKDGKKETIFKYNKIDYLVKFDAEKNRINLVPYKVNLEVLTNSER